MKSPPLKKGWDHVWKEATDQPGWECKSCRLKVARPSFQAPPPRVGTYVTVCGTLVVRTLEPCDEEIVRWIHES